MFILVLNTSTIINTYTYAKCLLVLWVIFIKPSHRAWFQALNTSQLRSIWSGEGVLVLLNVSDRTESFISTTKVSRFYRFSSMSAFPWLLYR